MSRIYKFAVLPDENIQNYIFQGFYHQRYYGYKKKDNPDFINYLKNSKNEDKTTPLLADSMNKVTEIIVNDIPQVIKEAKLKSPAVIAAARSKAGLDSNQLLFREAVYDGIKLLESYIPLQNETYGIVRHTSTATTHFKDNHEDTDPTPYKGISQDTCNLYADIRFRDVILIDDVYTPRVGVIEDFAQWLKKNGAKSVTIYTIALTAYCHSEAFERTLIFPGRIYTSKNDNKYIKLIDPKDVSRSNSIPPICVFEDDEAFEKIIEKPNEPLKCLISHDNMSAGYYRLEGLESSYE